MLSGYLSIIWKFIWYMLLLLLLFLILFRLMLFCNSILWKYNLLNFFYFLKTKCCHKITLCSNVKMAGNLLSQAKLCIFNLVDWMAISGFNCNVLKKFHVTIFELTFVKALKILIISVYEEILWYFHWKLFVLFNSFLIFLVSHQCIHIFLHRLRDCFFNFDYNDGMKSILSLTR